MVAKKQPPNNAVQNLADAISRHAFGTARSAARAVGVCVSCKQPPGPFNDKISEREWLITQLCQQCQDSVFAELKELEDG